MWNYDDSTVMSSVRDTYWSDDDKWRSTAEEGRENGGLQIAFGISAFDGNQEPIDNPNIGRVVARYQTWGFTDDNLGFHLSDPIPVRRCSRVDVGIAFEGTLSDQTVVKEVKNGEDVTWEQLRDSAFAPDFETKEPYLSFNADELEVFHLLKDA